MRCIRLVRNTFLTKIQNKVGFVMKNLLKTIVLLLVIPIAQAEFTEGVEYKTLATPQPTSTGDNIEVRELFWYGCPHCYHLEPELDKWLETKPGNVELVRMPAILGPSWELLGRAYYTAELLEVVDKIHKPLFSRLHVDRKRIRNEEELQAFFVEQGISAEDFQNTYNSFAVITKTRRSDQAAQLYGLTGVPALVVNGRYLVTASMAGSNEKMLKVVDFLIAREAASVGEGEPAVVH
jgi:thiol:disulfide interchange protein DsbA